MKRKVSPMTVCLTVLLTCVNILTNTVVLATANDAAAIESEQATPETMQSDDETNQPEGIFGENLESLSALNTVAINSDVVFIFVPGSENNFADDITIAAVFAAQQSLENNNINVGSYTLPNDSPDHPIISAQVQTPTVLVAVKGGGMVVIPCENISEEKLLQAYLACCDSSSGCCP